MRSSTYRLPLLVLGLLTLLAGSASADWLVTREGGRVETDGPWEVKGRLVVFTTAGGQLASLRTDDVDLEASRQATAEAVAASRKAEAGEPEEPAAEPPPPRRRITDADIPSGQRPAVAVEAAGEEEAEEIAGRPAGAAADLAVVFSEAEEAPDGHTRVRGVLGNNGELPAVGVRLTVHLYDHQGETLASVPAQLDRSALAAGQTTDFVCDFPDVFGYGAMSFEPRGTALETGDGEEAAEDEAAPAAEAGS